MKRNRNTIFGSPLRQHKHWDKMEVVQLIAMSDEGQSWQYIAWVLDRTESACRSRYSMARFARLMADIDSQYDWKSRIDPTGTKRKPTIHLMPKNTTEVS